MEANLNSSVDIRTAGTKVLIDAIGSFGYARFIQQFENGYRDYTKEKYEQPKPSLEELYEEPKYF